jgi:hypothetical protein
MPFHTFQTVSMTVRSQQVNSRGEIMTEKNAPEWFGDCAIHHRKALEVECAGMEAIGASWCRFASELSCMDKDYFGQKLSDDVFWYTFKGQMDVYMKAFCKSREGETLQISGRWDRVEDLAAMHQLENAHSCQQLWHVQYAKSPVKLSFNEASCRPQILDKALRIYEGSHVAQTPA